MTSKIRYRYRQVSKSGDVWVSPDVFEADTMHKVEQGVIAGFIMGEARSAETEDGKLLFGLDAKGKSVLLP